MASRIESGRHPARKPDISPEALLRNRGYPLSVTNSQHVERVQYFSKTVMRSSSNHLNLVGADCYGFSDQLYYVTQ